MTRHEQGAQPRRGLAGDIERFKVGASGTADELREFVSQLKGRRPDEMLGMVAGSNLVQATIQATIATFLVLVVFTVGPYGWSKIFPPAPKVAKVAEPAATTSAPPAASAATASAPAASDPAVSAPAVVSNAPPTEVPGEPSAASKKAALEKMGIGETKATDPKRNPLENSADDLLKDLK